VTRLDRAYLEALFAPDRSALSPERLAGIAPERVGALAPGLHVSAQLLASDFPAYSIWRANRSDANGPDADAAAADLSAIDINGGGETALIWRCGADGRHRVLAPGEAAFFVAIRDGATLGQAAEMAVEAHDGIDVAATLGGAFAAGVFADIEPEETP